MIQIYEIQIPHSPNIERIRGLPVRLPRRRPSDGFQGYPIFKAPIRRSPWVPVMPEVRVPQVTKIQ